MEYENVVYIVDDDRQVGGMVRDILAVNGIRSLLLQSPIKMLEQCRSTLPAVLISDVQMPEMDGLTLLQRVLEIDPDLPVITITGMGDISMAVEALQLGAFHFIEKERLAELLVETVKRALGKRAMWQENRKLRERLAAAEVDEDLIGCSPAMLRLRAMISSIAGADTNVLIRGDTGTGKEMVARLLHRHSPRSKGPFVAINCGAVPESIFESELFGHERGAFTGAQERRVGKMEFASGGTLFLDEIDSMPLALQVKLLRVLQERTIERLGSNVPIAVDVRLVAACQGDLLSLADAGRFREDLYYRLSVVPITVPPLRERREDIPLLFQRFLTEAAHRLDRKPPQLVARHFTWLSAQPWPGNVRELQNVAERTVLLGVGALGHAQPQDNNTPTTHSLADQVRAFEKHLIEQALKRNHGCIEATYGFLQIPRQTLYDKIKKYGIARIDFVD